MDSLILSLIDAVFFFIGKMMAAFLRKLGVVIPDLGHWALVVFGFVFFLIFLFCATLIYMEIFA